MHMPPAKMYKQLHYYQPLPIVNVLYMHCTSRIHINIGICMHCTMHTYIYIYTDLLLVRIYMHALYATIHINISVVRIMSVIYMHACNA